MSAADRAGPRLRVGIGYDSHRFGADRPLILGGVEIPFDRGLLGHSDADVLTHALIDALLGASRLGDIGTHFPDEDERWRGADSVELLRSVRELLDREGASPLNADATVVCEQPRLAAQREPIEALLSEVLGAPVSVKATTNEGMGWIGRGEGIAVTAVALVEQSRPDAAQ